MPTRIWRIFTMKILKIASKLASNSLPRELHMKLSKKNLSQNPSHAIKMNLCLSSYKFPTILVGQLWGNYEPWLHSWFCFVLFDSSSSEINDFFRGHMLILFFFWCEISWCCRNFEFCCCKFNGVWKKIDKNLKVQKNLKEPSRFLYMVQVSSQKYIIIFTLFTCIFF
jgi:hypothetical protein